MIPHFRRGWLACLVLLPLAIALHANPADAPWPVQLEGVPNDPAWTWGRLDNGLRYVVRRNAKPAGHISLRLAVEVGFAHEKPAEMGFAHFVEHMVFNGTKRFPGETLVPALRKHGVELGPELSAFTFLTHTLFGLDAPSCAPAELDLWFGVIRDFADGALIQAKQVKRERGVIASEARDRNSPGLRYDTARRGFFYPGSPLSVPFGGDPEKADAAKLKAFYEQWYRPERMILAVVGDLDPAEMERLVHEHFSSLRGRGTPPAPLDPGPIGNPPATQTFVVLDPTMGGLSFEIASVLPRSGAAETMAERRTNMARQILINILNRRLLEVQRDQPGRFTHLQVHSTAPTPYALETTIQASCLVAEWKAALETIEQELRRSLTYTYPGSYIREAKQSMLTGIEQYVQTRATVSSSDLAGEVIQGALWRVPALSPESLLGLVRETLPAIDAREMSYAWRSLWQERRARILAYGFLPRPYDHDTVRQVYANSTEQALDELKSTSAVPFAYTDFGPPGVVQERSHDTASDIHLVTFANGIRATIKHTPFEAGTVRVLASLGTGRQSEPADRPGLGIVADAYTLTGALGRHRPDELRQLLTESSQSLSFHCQEDRFLFSGVANANTSERLFQLIGAYLTDPGWHPDYFAQTITQIASTTHDLAFTPEGVIGTTAFWLLSGKDARYASPAEDSIRQRSLAELREWLTPVLSEAPLEVGIVGDIDPERAIGVLARTLGALPPRRGHSATDASVRFNNPPSPVIIRFPGSVPRAGVEITWSVNRYDDIRVSRQLEVLIAAFGDRLRRRLREELGAVYAPSFSAWKSEAAPGQGHLIAYVSCKPDQAAKLGRLIVDLADTLSRKGLTEEEFRSAREPVMARTESELKDNGYWLHHVVAKAHSEPAARTYPLTRLPDFAQMTRHDVNARAKEFLSAGNAVTFLALPPGR